jgi:hypothetical protein
MINLAYVDSLAGNEISVHGGRVFLLSRKYKKEFVAKMYEYIGDVQ